MLIVEVPVIITPMQRNDIGAVATVHSQQFSRQHHSTTWVSCNFAAFPRIMLFVARGEKSRQVVGYIQWIQKSGFRQEAVIELEQIAVLKNHQGSGIGTQLIKESLKLVKDHLSDNNSTLKAILISTRTDNTAQALYQKTLGAKNVAVIKNLYSHDEVILLAQAV